MISENLQWLRNRISKQCAASKRNTDNIKLIAVSKYFGINAINEANKLGIYDFGENKAQELRDKYQLLADKVTWHFIGTLQRNKVKYVIKAASLIHSVDSISLADEINNRAAKLDKVQKILLEIKTSSEETKAGIEQYEQISFMAQHCKYLDNIRLIGLMTMAPFTDNELLIRKSFSKLRKLKDELNKQGFNLSELSMGMTVDFEIAIDEGATMLRIGSAIFGQRDYSKDWRTV
ncbi:MAG: YggS family pyridoxal phosphate-dependent enzyme [Ignavibacteria bacterium]|nr:YggS family pyridoxal phosphate-dependent enzyme [Ignavibacteria bacterium]